MQRIAVIDYGMGNLFSVAKALEHAAPDAEVVVSADPLLIDSAARIVCPGQGAAADCMAALARTGLDRVVRETLHSRPFLGICMGLQVLLGRSEENGGTECLDLVPGVVRRFANPLTDAEGTRLKVPHMGWNRVCQLRQHPLWQGIDDGSRFYFAHSYYAVPDDAQRVTGSSEYGAEFCVALAGENFFACQFHPEKSAASGLRLLANFARWDGDSC